MALFGFQAIVTMVVACVIQKLSSKYTFSRRFIGDYYKVYIPPSLDELRTAANIQPDKHESRKRKNRANGRSSSPMDEAAFLVPRSANVPLKALPLRINDILQLKYFFDFQWLVDFAGFSVLIYIITELYYHLLGYGGTESNLSIVWCFLGCLFTFKTLTSLVFVYFKTTDAIGERSVCLLAGSGFLLIAMLILIVDERFLEFGLIEAYKNFSASGRQFFEQQALAKTSGPASELMFRFILAVWAAFMAVILIFPGIRFAQMHQDALLRAENSPTLKWGLQINFIFPLFIALLWFKPLARDYYVRAPKDGTTDKFFTEEAFESLRLILIVLSVMLRLALMPHYIQAYLDLAPKRLFLLSKEAGRMPAKDYQRIVLNVFNYMCVVLVQYVAPVLLLLFFTLLLKAMGNYSWAGGFVNFTKDDYYEPPGPASLRSVFNVAVFRGVLNFATWWLSAVTFSVSVVGFIYHGSAEV